MTSKPLVAVLKGDGIGPEVVDAAISLIPKLENYVELVHIQTGVDKYLKCGFLFSIEERKILDEAKAFFVGAFTTPLIKPKGFNSVIGFLRKTYDLATNIRPAVSIDNLSKARFNITIFRQNTEDLYYQKQYFRKEDEAVGEKLVTLKATQAISSDAFHYAKNQGYKKITIVTKANVLPLVDGFFKETAEAALHQLMDDHNFQLEVNHEYVDAAAYKLIKSPEQFELILTMNMYGDILSDVLAGMVGSIGLCPSANLSKNKGLFEPIHGSALDIANKGIANPVGAILALSMMLDWLSFPKIASLVKETTLTILRNNQYTQDLGGDLSTLEFIDKFRGFI
ncbi:MAG TPA: isocitrate/isopropylmalate family dehydrogenase [Patescibacteria group bacterium]|nr:isocitrate/isopropylmalate family dehydrogenase [Gammaproteobacteria bacterium]HWA51492.1 isocitrate/isopropylmalate family dehydrogenase [Patescibacteria group bacterium]